MKFTKHELVEMQKGASKDQIDLLDQCIKCGKVDEFVDKIIEQRQEAVAKQMGYKMTDHSLIIYGICNKCAKKSPK